MTERRSDEPGPDVRPVLTDEEIRSEVARHLRPSAFPADREALIWAAQEEDAPVAVTRVLERLPEDVTFQRPEDVLEALSAG